MRLRISVALLGLMLITAACGAETPDASGGGDDGDGGALTFWTVEDTQDRIEAQQAIVDRFTEATSRSSWSPSRRRTSRRR
jgi:ABC-type glycerol-3-phosphate transport system substrate-binding protein